MRAKNGQKGGFIKLEKKKSKPDSLKVLSESDGYESSGSDASYWSAVSNNSHLSDSPAKPGEGGIPEKDLKYYVKCISGETDCNYEELMANFDMRQVATYMTKEKIQEYSKKFCQTLVDNFTSELRAYLLKSMSEKFKYKIEAKKILSREHFENITYYMDYH